MIEANLLPSPAAQVPTQHIRYQSLHEMQRNQTDKATAETQQTSLICQTNGVLLELITGSFALHITEGAFTYTVHSHSHLSKTGFTSLSTDNHVALKYQGSSGGLAGITKATKGKGCNTLRQCLLI